MIWRVISHVPNLDKFEAAPVCPEDVIAPQTEDNALSYLWPSLQVSELAVFSEVPDQDNETILHKEFQHVLDPQFPFFL